MKWTPGTKNDDVVDVRGKSPGRRAAKVGGGGVIAALIVFVAARQCGVDLSGLLGGGGGGTTAQAPSEPTPPQGSGPDPEAPTIDRIRFTMKHIQDTFEAQFKASGKEYRRSKLYIFRNEIDTACGRSSSAIGPFYCPGDEQAYIDLSFWKALDQLGDKNDAGDFAQAYVLAHEMGHHLQTVLGIEKKTRRLGANKADKNEASVRQELQADCYAGVWGHYAAKDGLLEMGDLEEAIRAAESIGDDRLQKRAGREADPETFTHGTSAQRMKWFRVGFDAGKLDACDTFAAAAP